jgi:hypothetical protein
MERHPDFKDDEDDDQRAPNDEFGAAKRRVMSWRMIAQRGLRRKSGGESTGGQTSFACKSPPITTRAARLIAQFSGARRDGANPAVKFAFSISVRWSHEPEKAF